MVALKMLLIGLDIGLDMGVQNHVPLQAAELVREFVNMWPMMRPLVLVLKLFLQQRELNEVYTGEGCMLVLAHTSFGCGAAPGQA